MGKEIQKKGGTVFDLFVDLKATFYTTDREKKEGIFEREKYKQA